jgi:hypothetical protein
MKCTGCNSDAIHKIVESESGDYPLCKKCNGKYRATGFIPASSLITHLQNMTLSCQIQSNTN